MMLSQLKGKLGKKSKRVGRGAGSGRGKTSGRGHKGTGQRKGRMYYIGFLGGNVPYLRKIPKRGFNSKRRREFQIVNLDIIGNKLKEEKIIDPKRLKELNIIDNENKPVKILARVKDEALDFTNKIFKAHKFSKKAKEIIEEKGGKIECLQL